jgi:cobalamin biosynthesis protein CobW
MSTQKTPATVITGFLGAGKTTLIRNLLNRIEGRRIALVINEFGDVGVDGKILRGCGEIACREDDIIELANGCICCTVAEDFIPTMKKLLDRPQPPDHIIIETSGLALPQPLVRAFNWPEIKSKVTVDGVVTVVDAKAVSEGRFADDENAVEAQRLADPTLDHENPIEELFEDQLNCADLVLLNKTDLLQPEESQAIASQIRNQLRKGVNLIQVQNGCVDPAVLLGLGSAAEGDTHNRLSHHEMEGEEQHDHDDFVTFVVELDESPSKEALLTRISDALSKHDVLRLKGFAAVKGSSARLLVQAVGPRLNHYFDRAWGSSEQRLSEFVVIGEKAIDRNAITAILRG